ncbi:hypothetical protein TNCV_2329741 [Trichonephila clavipes]|nr:hypothetical protein TNCV_2329741 [Trichonephila clavipes]
MTAPSSSFILTPLAHADNQEEVHPIGCRVHTVLEHTSPFYICNLSLSLGFSIKKDDFFTFGVAEAIGYY